MRFETIGWMDDRAVGRRVSVNIKEEEKREEPNNVQTLKYGGNG